MVNSKIHPTALIDSSAKIGKNVVVGPFCVIEGGVVLEENCQLQSHIFIKSGTSIGKNTKIYSHAVLGEDPQDHKHKGGMTTLTIGENCTIREGVTMHRGSDAGSGRTIVGNGGSFFAYAHVAHDCIVGNNVIFANNVMLGGHVVIGDGVIIGGGGAVHQNVHIGKGAFLGGLGALVNDLIPYGLAMGVHASLEGLNLRGMKRAQISKKEIEVMRQAYDLLFDREKSIKERLEEVKNQYSHSTTVQELICFIEGERKRALCTPKIL